MKWKPPFEGAPNVSIQSEHFYISYNPMPTDTRKPETAIVLKDSDMHNPYWIIEGDHRKKFEKLIDKGFRACFEYLLMHRTKKVWSSNKEENINTILDSIMRGN